MSGAIFAVLRGNAVVTSLHGKRHGVPPSPDAAVVIRGGPDTLSLLHFHARRLNRLYVLDGVNVFGISVFVARDEIGPASERSILSSKLRNYAAVYRSTVSTLNDAGFELLPTFIASPRAPPAHFTDHSDAG